MRRRTPKPGEIIMQWSKRENDIETAWGEGVGMSATARLLYNVCAMERLHYDFLKTGNKEPSLWAELEARGYDLTTLRFSIRKKEGHE